MYEGNPGEIDFGSSYRELTVTIKCPSALGFLESD